MELEKKIKINGGFPFQLNVSERIELCSKKDLTYYKKFNIVPHIGLESCSKTLLFRMGKILGNAKSRNQKMLIKKGIEHRGFAMIDILQPCVSFNRKNTFQWYRERVYKLEEESGFDPADEMAAFNKAQEWGERIPIGLIYKKDKAVYEEQLPALKDTTLVRQKIDPQQFEELLDEFM